MAEAASGPRGLSRIGAALAVKNSTAQKLADVYFEDKLGRGSAAKLLKVPTTATKAASTALLKQEWASLVG